MHTAFSAPLVAASSGGGGYSLLFFIVIIGGMFWFMSRAQRRQRQRMQDVQSKLLPGQEVMTGSGIYGRVVDALDDRVRVEVAPGVVMTFAKQAIARTVDETAPFDAPPVAGPDTVLPESAPPGATAESGDSRETKVAD